MKLLLGAKLAFTTEGVVPDVLQPDETGGSISKES